jgi:hypothetical protein
METLLEKAKKVPVRSRIKRSISGEDIELALAWMKGEVTLSQVAKVSRHKTSSGNVLYRVAVCLREAYMQGLIKIK